MRDVTARKTTEDQLSAVIDTAMDGIIIAGEDQRVLSCNPAALEMFGYSEEEVVDQSLNILMPERFRSAHGAHVRLFGESGETRRTRESFGVLTACRKDGLEFPIEASVSRFQDNTGRTLFAAFVRDISERVSAETALRESEQRFRALVDAFSQIVWTNSPKGRLEGDQPGWAAFTGQTRDEYQGFGWAEAVHPEDRQPAVEEWNRCVRERVPYIWQNRIRRFDGVYRTFSIRGVPVLAEDGTIREWVGIHTDITEQRANEAALRDSLERERERAKREVLLNQIGDGIRQSLPPEEIEALSVRILGETLAVDRCYLFTADAAQDTLIIYREWCAEGIVPITGQYRLSDLGIDVDAVFGSGKTLVVSHLRGEEQLSEQNATANQGYGVSSLVNVPFYEGGRFVGALAIAMARGARQWTAQEVALVETVAGQLRSTLEAARLQQRERTIADQLQAALQPPAPPFVPGIKLASFYRPALEEAGVGGDFYDVFTVEQGYTALVVADLSGKGLAAAQQVAIVKNMLRFAVYNGQSISDAINVLHRTLFEHDLLTGFATLFVGLYAHNEHTLTYVNCGQEAGLIWRAATRQVEELSSTGPVLGGFSSGSYEHRTIALTSSDVLALFTDGLTEVGPNRQELLGLEGVIGILHYCCSDTEHLGDPETIVHRVIAAVDNFGLGGIQDDIALLVGIVTDGDITL